MTVNIYKCDTCDREIELLENKKGVDFIQRCIITQGCRGKLFLLSRKIDFIRNNLPDDVEGLNNRVERKVLYNHSQSLQASEWIINHNLGINPSVQVFVNKNVNGVVELVEVEPKNIQIIDKNNTLVSFNSEETGTVQCLSKSSQDLTKLNNTTIVDVKATQVTSNTELTIATLSQDENITIDLEYTTTNGIIVEQYVIDNVPSTKSPWLDLDTILFKGKTYTIRSFNILTPNVLNDTINNGATIKAQKINNNPVGNEDMLLLLSNEPFTSFDKNKNQYIDLKDTIDTNFSLYYNNSEFFAVSSIISNIFPPLTQ